MPDKTFQLIITRAAVDYAVAVAVEETIVGLDPAGAFFGAIQIMVEVDKAGGVETNDFEAVSAKEGAARGGALGAVEDVGNGVGQIIQSCCRRNSDGPTRPATHSCPIRITPDAGIRFVYHHTPLYFLLPGFAPEFSGTVQTGFGLVYTTLVVGMCNRLFRM